MKTKPIFAVCVGAQKAGTTWLYQCLREHPTICCSSSKETHFFSVRYQADVSTTYEPFYQHCTDHGVWYESSTSYLSDPDAPSRIHDYRPDAHIIIITRDPIERSFSHFLHLKARDKLSAASTVADAINQQPTIIEHSLYGKHLQNYLKYFPPKQILLLDHKDVLADPQNTIHKICDFLAIEHFTPRTLRTNYHSARARSHAWYFPLNRTYLRLRRHHLGQYLLHTLRTIGINGRTVDWALRSLAKPKPTLTTQDHLLLSSRFENDQSLYQQLQHTKFTEQK